MEEGGSRHGNQCCKSEWFSACELSSKHQAQHRQRRSAPPPQAVLMERLGAASNHLLATLIGAAIILSSPRVYSINRPHCILHTAIHRKHMAVRIYRAAANRGAPIRASLRRARPIRCAEQDPCLRVVQRCGHVTLGEGMPTWTRGKDGMCERATTITRRRRTERPTYSEWSTALRSSAEPRTVGWAKCPRSSCSDRPERRRRSINRSCFMTQANLRLVDSCAGAVAFRRIASLSTAPPSQTPFCARPGADAFLPGSFPSPHVSGCVRSGPCSCSAWSAHFGVRGPAATCAWRSDSSNKQPLHKPVEMILPGGQDSVGTLLGLCCLIRGPGTG